MALSNSEYAPVTKSIAREQQPAHSKLPIILKDGSQLKDIMPYGFVTRKVQDSSKKPTLNLLYLDQSKQVHEIDASQINGVEVIVENGTPYLVVTYYNPKGNYMEEDLRYLKIKRVNYGVHPNHKNEVEDFYIVADVKKYLDEGKTGEAAERSFPFWRLGIYGDPNETQKIFQPTIP
ncbi:MAG: hypothetical protein AAB929_03020 [Patescibacteria group bacterium]